MNKQCCVCRSNFRPTDESSETRQMCKPCIKALGKHYLDNKLSD